MRVGVFLGNLSEVRSIHSLPHARGGVSNSSIVERVKKNVFPMRVGVFLRR